MEEKKFQPYVPADKVMPEFTVVSVVLGAILAIIFGGANAYLGLRVGMTVSASIPAAVISMGVIRKILRRDSILENNMVQTIGSAGESVAAGAIFTLPALFMWAKEGLCDVPSLVEIGLIALCGGVLGVLIIAVVMWLLPAIPLNLFTALIVIVFGFFFATVSSRMVGLIGSSNNPVSGMAIATLLISTLLLKATGNDGINGMIAAIVIGGIICVIAAIAGDTSQDLKTGFLVGATPKKQQIGEIVGVVVSAIAIGAILYLLSMAWGGYGSDDLPAPQAVLMKMIVEGVMGGNLPWNLVLVGVFIALVVEVLGIPVLPFAIGLYLPIYLSVPMMLGGLLRWYLEKRKYASDKDKENTVQSGVLYSSGLIAGEGIVGILLAVLAIIPAGLNAKGDALYVSDKINLSAMFGISIGKIGGLVFFAVILFTIYLFATKDSKKK